MDAGALTAHRAVVEAGPVGVRRLCCSTTTTQGKHAQVALEAIDDAVTLVDHKPVTTGSLWRSMLHSLVGEGHPSLAVIHPSWWSAARVAVLRCAAAGAADDAALYQRSQVLPAGATVVEIADRFVVITGARKVAQRRCGEACLVADSVARVAAEMTAQAIVIDAPAAISGASELAAAISYLIRDIDPRLVVTVVGDAEFCAAAVRLSAADEQPDGGGPPGAIVAGRRRGRALIPVVLFVIAAAALAFAGLNRRPVPPTVAMPTTLLVEGRVALTVPAQWATRRIVAGPGSARVQITSPSDPDAALHVTQSLVADATLSDTAETIRRAIDEAPDGVFLDFNPTGHSSGRPAVTYREVRAAHDVRWTVMLDGAVRISIGCQSRRGDDAAVHEACELAARSAHALD